MIFIICFSAALAFAIGNIFQKQGLHKVRVETSSTFEMIRGTVLNIPWLLGIGLSVFGTLSYYYALAKWPISTVQALLSLNPSLTAILGILILKEFWDKKTMSGIVLVALGVVCVSLDKVDGSSQLGVAFWPVMFIFVSIVLILVLVSWFPNIAKFSQPEIKSNEQIEPRKITKNQEYRRGEYLFSIIAGMGFGISAVFYKAVLIQMNGAELEYSRLDLTSGVMIVFYAISYIIGFFSSQAALSYGRALFVVPFSAAIGSVIPIFCGIITLGEEAGPLKWSGLIIISIALFLFIPRGDFSNIHKE